MAEYEDHRWGGAVSTDPVYATVTLDRCLTGRTIHRAWRAQDGAVHILLDGGELFRVIGKDDWSYTTQPSAQQLVGLERHA